ncbi:hypothetical protein ZIOFF_013297 [Zingiber officinale]|uniref:Protein kinase domain-containing protein n=1 Tax=Zingiber officinale TaxID=94328 RepID=A0A8J5LNT3_ZINOF|nr:hypothetical protein ZIOFF_013297 [Zingiber officinale]
MRGSCGYLAPEYALQGHLTKKADIYSFGVVLLEIITGRSNSRSFSDCGKPLLEWVWNLFEENRLTEVVDPALEEYPQENSLERSTTNGRYETTKSNRNARNEEHVFIKYEATKSSRTSYGVGNEFGSNSDINIGANKSGDFGHISQSNLKNVSHGDIPINAKYFNVDDVGLMFENYEELLSVSPSQESF